MKTKLMFVLMAFSIVVWAGAGLAADRPTLSTEAGQGDVYYPEPNRVDVTIWCNGTPVNTTGFSSQLDEIYPFESWVADDYTSTGDEAIEKVQWWGSFFNHVPPAIQPGSWILSIYDDPGNCDPGLAGTVPETPTAPIFQRVITDFTTSADLSGNDDYEYSAVLDGGVNGNAIPQDAGRTYWITIQAVMDFSLQGQWGWNAVDGVTDCTSVNLFPLLDVITWTLAPSGLDRAFCLYYVDDPIAVENQSWGSLKALFK